MTYVWARFNHERTEILRDILKSKRYEQIGFRKALKAIRNNPHITGWRMVRDGIVIAQSKDGA